MAAAYRSKRMEKPEKAREGWEVGWAQITRKSYSMYNW